MDLLTLYQSRVDAGVLRDDPAQRAILPEFERIRAALAQPVKKGFFRKAPPPPKGVYLWGGVGSGKSMMMDLFVESLAVPNRRVHFHAFMQEIQNALHEARKGGAKDAIDPVAKAVSDSVRVLAFDEMQIKDIADAMIVGRLFEKLFEAGVVIVTTSNRIPRDLYKDGLNRQLFLPFIDLISEKLVVKEIVSDTDYRQNRLKGEETYFTPISPDTARADGCDLAGFDFGSGQGIYNYCTRGVRCASLRSTAGLGGLRFLICADKTWGRGIIWPIANNCV
jgi:cell division protein ZapE